MDLAYVHHMQHVRAPSLAVLDVSFYAMVDAPGFAVQILEASVPPRRLQPGKAGSVLVPRRLSLTEKFGAQTVEVCLVLFSSANR